MRSLCHVIAYQGYPLLFALLAAVYLNPITISADFPWTAMTITNKQKMYGVVLVVGAAAFVIDRTYFTPPKANAAPAATDLLLNHPDSKADSLALLEPSITSEGIITSKLKSVGPLDWDHLADAFAPQWLAARQPAQSHSDFQDKHKVTAILASHNGGGAIVNGSLVRVGESVDGFTLASVNRQGAIFTSGETQVSVHLAQQ